MTDVAATVLKQNSDEIWTCLGFSNLMENDSVPLLCDSRITYFLSGFMSAIMFDPIISEHKWSRCLIEMVIPTLADDGSEICP